MYTFLTLTPKPGNLCVLWHRKAEHATPVHKTHLSGYSNQNLNLPMKMGIFGEQRMSWKVYNQVKYNYE